METANILIVEDNRIIATEIKERLLSLGYNVCDIAYNGEDGIAKAIKYKPELILMDIKLGDGIDGIEASGRIKNLLYTPVIYLTAYADEETLNRAKQTEPYGYIVKPIGEKELRSVIEISLYKHRMEQKLTVSENKYKSMVESLDGYLYIVSENKDIKYINPKLESIIGKINSETKCYKKIYGSKTECSWCSLLYASKGRIVRNEIKGFEEGKWFNQITVPVKLINGNSLIQVLLIDITEKKNQEELILGSIREKEILLNEIHHRIKNNLQIIISLVKLQSTKISSNENQKILNSLENRIKTLSLLEEHLYSTFSFNKILLGPFMHNLVSYYIQKFSFINKKINIDTNFRNLVLNIDTVIPLSLIVSELLSNSYLHAFKDLPGGNVELKLNLIENGKYLLSYKDDGVGLKKEIIENHTKTLGLELTECLTKQLGGDIKYLNNYGTGIEIEFTSSDYKRRT
jgi:two-component sensor histidine kinase/AmiR/NasT family two-component response regulator